jgi:RNA polymerase sigma factor (sigma-70 family)
MAKGESAILLRQVRTLFAVGTVGGLTDGELLERYKTSDGEMAEPAFAALVERHGSMVLRVCRVVLRDEHEARDAFQATFLILVRKAGTLRVRDSLGPWLHQVALRVASCTRSGIARRQRHERMAGELAAARSPEGPDHGDLKAVLHEEIDRLPERLRAPVVLCFLEGLTREQAARRLGWPLGTVQSRLARGRDRLRDRLTRRGLAPAVALSRATFSGGAVVAQVPGELINPLIRAATHFAAGNAAPAEVVSAAILALTEGVLTTMMLTKLKMAGIALLLIGLAATGAGLWASQETGTRDESSGRASREKPVPGEADRIPPVVARVNDRSITREELVERCLAKHGAEELEKIIGLAVLEGACERRGIKVTDDELEAEVVRIARGFGLSTEDWYRTLDKERGIAKGRYRREMVYPGLLYKKLGGDSNSDSLFQDLKRKAEIKVYFAPFEGRGGEGTQPRVRSQEDRLRDVERRLDEVLKSLDDLKGIPPRGRS